MSLPKQSHTVYNLTIPSTGEIFKYRQFLVRDQKSLLIAAESDFSVQLDTIKNVIKNCALSPIAIDDLATFDIEYIFLNLRAVSVGEVVELQFECPEDHGEDNNKAIIKVSINLQELNVIKNENHTNKIPLFDDVGVIMKYPTYNDVAKIKQNNTVDGIINTIVYCIDSIYDSQQIYSHKDQTEKELLEFVENLTEQQLQKIQVFFDTMPILKKDISVKCPVCQKQYDQTISGLEAFLA